jgi:gamma-glutamylcyclotransferase (GGCT)/AIG2-like uncharacterized protein YtfP
MKHILVFGSLRKHSKRGYNHNRCGEQQFIKQIKLQGFELYDLGDYPTICEGNGEITAELHGVDETTFARIGRMESGAGYQEKIVNIDGVDATIYVWNKAQIEKYKLPRIENGDWD